MRIGTQNVSIYTTTNTSYSARDIGTIAHQIDFSFLYAMPFIRDKEVLMHFSPSRSPDNLLNAMLIPSR